MLFYEPIFLIFFPVLYVLYLTLRGRTARNWTLLIASLFFYAWGEPAFVLVLLVSILIDYWLAQKIATSSRDGGRTWLAIGITGNLAVLAFYKYADFIAANLNIVLTPISGLQLPLLKIALPIGVSFVVFEKITYLVDTWRGVSKPAARISDYALFVLLFPKLLAGPILKYHEMADQIAAPRTPEWDDFWQGLLRFSRGLAKKLLIADVVATFADQAFAASPGSLSMSYAWLGLLCFTLQIYFDFSGYSDMAIGLARMFGYRLRENFNQPYISQTVSEFWRRWHISLTTFIRDYLYYPLGGNKLGAFRTYLNLWICFLASGLWHGASWNFVLWGAYNGLFLTLDRMFLSKALHRSGKIVATAVTLLIVMIGWAIFRTTSLDHFIGYGTALTGMKTGTPDFDVPGDVAAIAIAGVVICLFPAFPFYDRLRQATQDRTALRLATDSAVIVLYLLSIARAMSAPFKPFIYFRF